MAEGRFISRSIATNGQLKRVSLEADYLFSRMIPHLDREGRLDGDPDVVKAVACPLRAELTPELVATSLSELDSVGLVEWYEVDGVKVVWFPAFKEHQRGMKPERERPSRLPSHDAQGAKPVRRRITGGVPEPSSDVAGVVPPREVKVSQGKGSEGKPPAVNRFAFMAELRPVWFAAYGGELPKGSATLLEPLVIKHGTPKVAANLKNFCAAHEAQFVNIHRFPPTFGSWDSPPVTLIGVGRDPTPEELKKAGIFLT